jgi:hypothetical protein
MTTDRFETIPAWRIARLRVALHDAQRRGADPVDVGDDLPHRALQRRFTLGRVRQEQQREDNKRTTRKGRRFSAAKQEVIWRAILNHRPPGWRSGDKVPFGSIRRAHNEAIERCRAAGLAPPRYRTIYVLWHHGKPSPDVLASLRHQYDDNGSNSQGKDHHVR